MATRARRQGGDRTNAEAFGAKPPAPATSRPALISANAQLHSAVPSHDKLLQLQPTIGNSAARVLLQRSRQSTSSTASTRIQRGNDFTFGNSSAEKTRLGRADLDDEVERLIEEHHAIEDLFIESTVVNSVRAWGQFVFENYLSDYILDDVTSSDVVAAVRHVKERHREETLLRLAQNAVYRTSDILPYSLENLKEILQDAGVILENDDDEVLSAILETEGAFARTKVTVPEHHLLLSDHDNIVVILDNHQNKHQRIPIPGLPTENVGQGSQFAEHEGLEYHEAVTGAQVRETIAAAINDGTVSPTSGSVSPLKRPIDGIIYDLTITYDAPTGKYVGSYHCNPNVSRA